MSNITNTEIVACKLFGWRVGSLSEYSRLEQQGKRPRYKWKNVNDDVLLLGETDWPNFTDERLAPYWRDRLEDALCSKAMWSAYEKALLRIVLDDAGYKGIEDTAPSLYLMLRAKPAQRLEAAVRVLDEVGL